ncbi:hypothetical protein VTK73DRAFT_9203 [Phialemonium thermophilum]|uniref:Uncharacterized protein n=1 Tax=Phialemonium thermophilum TaxID=223376 RepID=A0ABR3XLG1_9PEZI
MLDDSVEIVADEVGTGQGDADTELAVTVGFCGVATAPGLKELKPRLASVTSTAVVASAVFIGIGACRH